MDFAELVYANRTCRRFRQDRPVSRETLVSLIDLARVTASAGNIQPLKYAPVCEQADRERLFPLLGWAAYLSGWKGPAEGQRPAGYIVICCDTDIAKQPGCDHGIAAQTILLGARALGLAGAMIGAFNAGSVQKALDLAANLNPVLVIALGEPAETVRIIDVGADGNICYFRDDRDCHVVPKRRLEDILAG
ncbi:MAG: nitroreductase family protein [Thermodesulfobacteriota bacterium]